jgi:adenosylmethionine-8-amino-7-oxononanoate aminotransferase
MTNGIFITGTDTGVGKTIVASAIAQELQRQGIKVGPMKPIQTGAPGEAGVRYSQDLEFMKKALGDHGLELNTPFLFNPHVPYLLKEPLAPYVAAKLEGVDIDLSVIRQAYCWLQEHYSFLVVEGAGGIFVPILQDYLFIDLIKDFGLPVVLVGRATLGTINHTLLTLEALRKRNIPIAGVVLNKEVSTPGGICELTNPEVIHAFGQVELLGVLPHSPSIQMEQGNIGNLAELTEGHLHLDRLLKIIEHLSSENDSQARSSRLKALDKKYLWHPFTQMQDWTQEEPLIIERGKGVYLEDTEGQQYLDGVASLWTNVHGHQKQEIDLAIRDQLDKIGHSTLLGLTHSPAIELAERLIRIAPEGLSRVFYSDSGATACEIALKMSYQYWQQQGKTDKKSFVYFENSYHGDTLGAVSVGGIDLFHRMYHPLLFGAYRSTSPYCYRCIYHLDPVSCRLRCLNDLERIFQAHASEVSALIIEPCVHGAGGMIVAPEGFLKGVRELCTQYQILMIADEVAVGFGRTGKMFACEHEGVHPDLLCLAKGITGGYLPLAATLTTEAIYQGFLGDYGQKKTFFHGHTYTGNPLACRAALANMDIFEKERVIEQLQGKIHFLREKLSTFRNLPHVGDIRQKGLLAGIELVRNKATREPYVWEEKIGMRVAQAARKRGVILRPLGDVMVIMPPLSISILELEQLLSVTMEAIREITET